MESAIQSSSQHSLTNNRLYWGGDAFVLINQISRISSSILFYANINPHFPTHEIAYYKKINNAWEVSINFMNLYGHHGALPSYYQSLAIKSKHEKNHAMVDFLNLFQNRLASLYYQSWCFVRPAVRFNRSTISPLDKLLMALAGVERLDLLPHRSLLRYAGFFKNRLFSRSVIEMILREHFDLPIFIRDLKCSRLPMPDLYHSNGIGALGLTTVLGTSTQHYQTACEIVIGPLEYETFNRLLPGSLMSHAVIRLVNFLIPAYIQVHICLLLHRDCIPLLCLDNQSSMKLGFTTWCYSNSIRGQHGIIRWLVRGHRFSEGRLSQFTRNIYKTQHN